MKVQIWSDVMCPFCYIGKRRFEQALSTFNYRDEVEIEWKSFQLNPALKTNTSISVYQSLADSKGWQLDYAKQVTGQVAEMAEQVNLNFNFDNAVVANSFKAHRFSHLAKKYNLGNQAEELLFRSYFTDGKNIDDDETLSELGKEVGLNPDEVIETLSAPEAYAADVNQDIQEAESLGIRGVPFFVVNNKYAVSGAQATEVFLNTLYTAYAEWQQEPTERLNTADGPACSTDGDC
jgi:predicted DsbA family dithiol-disulfide isomerase